MAKKGILNAWAKQEGTHIISFNLMCNLIRNPIRVNGRNKLAVERLVDIEKWKNPFGTGRRGKDCGNLVARPWLSIG
jgi:hypothetical protein